MQLPWSSIYRFKFLLLLDEVNTQSARDQASAPKYCARSEDFCTHILASQLRLTEWNRKSAPSRTRDLVQERNTFSMWL